MTEKELKKLNRYQLLELIIIQAEELEKVKSELEETRAQLNQRNIAVENAGSIAQAALQLSGIFETAQAAADLYLENIAQLQNQAQQTLDNAKKEAQAILQNAKETTDCSAKDQNATQQ